jgi:hypothetical protein
MDMIATAARSRGISLRAAIKIELPSGNLSAGRGILVGRCLVPCYLWCSLTRREI